MTRSLSGRVVAVTLLMGLLWTMAPAAVHAETPPGRLAGASFPVVLIAPPVADSEHMLFAQQLLQLLVVRIVNDNVFRVVHPELVSVSLKRNNHFPLDLKEGAVAVSTAFDVGAAYVLDSMYTRTGAAGTWSLVLTSSITGTAVWDGVVVVDHERPARTVQQAAEWLRGASLELRLVTLADVQMLLELQEFDRAATLLDRYSEHHLADPRVDQLRQDLERARADEYFRRANTFGEIRLYDEAFVNINRALALEPDRPDFREYVATLRRASIESENASREERLLIISQVMESGYWDSAELLLSREPNPEHPDVQELRAELEELSGAHRAFQRATEAFWRRDYVVARAEVRIAIRRDPEQLLYGTLLREIDRAEREQQEAEDLLVEYRRTVSQLDLRSMVVTPKHPTPRWEAGIGLGNTDYRDRQTLSGTAVPQLVLRGAFFRPRLLPVALDSSVFSLSWAWHAGGLLRAGVREVDHAVADEQSQRILERDRLWSLGPVGGASLQAGVFGFSLGFGLEVETSLLLRQQLRRDPLADTENSSASVAFMPAMKWFCSLAWHMDRRSTVTLLLERTIFGDAFPDPSATLEQFQPRSFVVSYGRSLR